MASHSSSLTNLPPKAQEILASARSLIQVHGCNGFSFRDVADEVGIKSASIHYHFPSKSDLIHAVAAQYRAEFNVALEAINLSVDASFDKLQAFANLYVETLETHGKVCLGGVLATEAESLDETVRAEVGAFFEDQSRWLVDKIERGQADGSLRQDIDAASFAPTIVSALEGAMIIARNLGAVEYLKSSAKQILLVLKN